MTRYRQYADSEQKLLRHLCRRRIDVEHPASASPGLTRSDASVAILSPWVQVVHACIATWT